MNTLKKDLIEKFFKRARIQVTVDGSPAAEVSLKKDTITIEIKDPIQLMGLGLDLHILKLGKDKEKSVFRKYLKSMGYKIKVRYKFFEVDL